jgi:hypothetical protein
MVIPVKTKLYKKLISRMDEAVNSGNDVEAAWYAYAVLEDRLRSMLRQSGGDGEKKGKGKPIRMMGPKIVELKKRSQKDSLLANCFAFDPLNDWKNDRNNLVHAMADGQHDIIEIDELASKLAKEGVALARIYSTNARRLKANRAKVTLPDIDA